MAGRRRGRAARPTAAGHSPADVGGQLVAAREEAAGLTASTRSPPAPGSAPASSAAMESGDFAPCGGAVYARGHLRSIAHVVGADDKTWVAAYDRMAGQVPPSAATVLEAQPTTERPAPVPFSSLAKAGRPPLPTTVQVTGRPEGPTPAATSRPVRRRPDRAARPAAGARPPQLTAGDRRHRRRGAHHRGGRRRPGPAAPPRHGPRRVAGLDPPAATSTAPTAPATTPTAPQTLADAGVNVVVKISSSASWVHVVDATGTLVFQGILTPGTTKSFHSAQQLKFIFGYAPAVKLTVNGHAIGSPPATGSSDVADAVFDAQSGA